MGLEPKGTPTLRCILALVSLSTLSADISILLLHMHLLLVSHGLLIRIFLVLKLLLDGAHLASFSWIQIHVFNSFIQLIEQILLVVVDDLLNDWFVNPLNKARFRLSCAVTAVGCLLCLGQF